MNYLRGRGGLSPSVRTILGRGGLVSGNGKGNLVRSLNNSVVVLGFILLESSSCVFILDTILIGIRLRGQLLFGLAVGGGCRLAGRCRFVGRRGGAVYWRWGSVRTGIGSSTGHQGRKGNKPEHDVM